MLRKAKLLLVEDNAGLRAALGAALTSLNFDVVSTGSADAAYDIITTDSIDAVLLDVRLPHASGLDLHDAIVKRRPTMRERVALITGYGDSEEVVNWRKVNGGTVFEKPVRPEDLARWASRVTDTRRG